MSVLDLGSGTGMLGIGSALVGCNLVICVDCDEGAMAVARENVHAMELENKVDGEGCTIEFVLGKVNHVPDLSKSKSHNGDRSRGGGRGERNKTRNQKQKKQWRNLHRELDYVHSTFNLDSTCKNHDGVPLSSNCVDTVLTNPPFGTKQNMGIDIAFLRAATRLARRAVWSFHKSSTRSFLVKTVEEWGYNVEVVAQMKFDIPKIYKFHTKENVNIEVDLIRILLI